MVERLALANHRQRGEALPSAGLRPLPLARDEAGPLTDARQEDLVLHAPGSGPVKEETRPFRRQPGPAIEPAHQPKAAGWIGNVMCHTHPPGAKGGASSQARRGPRRSRPRLGRRPRSPGSPRPGSADPASPSSTGSRVQESAHQTGPAAQPLMTTRWGQEPGAYAPSPVSRPARDRARITAPTPSTRRAGSPAAQGTSGTCPGGTPFG